jgi:Tat protein translocase TatC
MALSDDPDQPKAGPGVRLPGLRHNPEGSMPLMEHIRELRNRVFKMVLFITAGAIAGWYLYPHIWQFIEAPYCRLNLTTHVQVTGGNAKGCQLFVTGIFDAFFLRLKIAIISGVILSSPLWLYQFWAFLAPGLYARERRWAYFFAGSAIPLFAIGSALAYFAMTKGLHFLLLLVPHNVVPIITINTYLGYAIAMLTIFGIAFELPLGRGGPAVPAGPHPGHRGAGRGRGGAAAGRARRCRPGAVPAVPGRHPGRPGAGHRGPLGGRVLPVRGGPGAGRRAAAGQPADARHPVGAPPRPAAGRGRQGDRPGRTGRRDRRRRPRGPGPVRLTAGHRVGRPGILAIE